MQALKAIVIGMGALIVLAVVLIGYGLYKKSVDPGWKLFGTRDDATAVINAATSPDAFGEIDLQLADDCFVEDVRPDGHRAYLLLGPASICDGIIVIDSEDGRVLGRINPR